MEYRRAKTPGAIYFFTVVTYQRQTFSDDAEMVDLLRDCFRLVKQRRCGEEYKRQRGASRLSKGEQAVWQRRFWEHQIRDERDFAQHVDYIHFNPVSHGLVTAPKDWPYSSFHRYVRDGCYPIDWGSDGNMQFPPHIGNE